MNHIIIYVSEYFGTESELNDAPTSNALLTRFYYDVM